MSLVGHDHERSLLGTYLPPSALLVGPPSVGKSDLARWAANHHGATALDITEVGMLSMPGARDVIASQRYRPAGKVRVAIGELTPTSQRAQNALLKVLEEPANRCHIVLTTASLVHVLPTVISRCFVIRVRSLSDDEVAEVLTTILGWEPERAVVAAALSGGTVAGAVAAEETARVREKALSVIRAMCSTDLLLQDNALASLREMDGAAVLVVLQRWATEAKTGQYRWFGPAVGAEIIRRGRMNAVAHALNSGARPVLAVRGAFVAARPRLGSGR